MASKFGVAAKVMNLSYPEHSNMAAKLIWQHYRQAMDKEWNVSCFDDKNIFIKAIYRIKIQTNVPIGTQWLQYATKIQIGI